MGPPSPQRRYRFRSGTSFTTGSVPSDYLGRESIFLFTSSYRFVHAFEQTNRAAPADSRAEQREKTETETCHKEETPTRIRIVNAWFAIIAVPKTSCRKFEVLEVLRTPAPLCAGTSWTYARPQHLLTTLVNGLRILQAAAEQEVFGMVQNGTPLLRCYDI